MGAEGTKGAKSRRVLPGGSEGVALNLVGVGEVPEVSWRGTSLGSSGSFTARINCIAGKQRRDGVLEEGRCGICKRGQIQGWNCIRRASYGRGGDLGGCGPRLLRHKLRVTWFC